MQLSGFLLLLNDSFRYIYIYIYILKMFRTVSKRLGLLYQLHKTLFCHFASAAFATSRRRPVPLASQPGHVQRKTTNMYMKVQLHVMIMQCQSHNVTSSNIFCLLHLLCCISDCIRTFVIHTNIRVTTLPHTIT